MSEPPYVLGILHLQAGHYADAARELSTSLKLQPENGDGWATLGSVYNHLDQLPRRPPRSTRPSSVCRSSRTLI